MVMGQREGRRSDRHGSASTDFDDGEVHGGGARAPVAHEGVDGDEGDQPSNDEGLVRVELTGEEWLRPSATGTIGMGGGAW
jgi:hypothetical protein